MAEQETTEHTAAVMPFEELHELAEAYDQAARPADQAAFLRSAWKDGKDISKFGEPASAEEIVALRYDDARAFEDLADRLGLSLQETEDLLKVISYAHTAREQYAWEREQFSDKPDRWSEHFEIWAWLHQDREALASGITTLARMTGETYMLTSRSSRFKVTPETAPDEVMDWYSLPTPEQSLEAEGYIDPGHFMHHYAWFLQAERGLVEKQGDPEYRIKLLTKAFRDFGNVDWYSHVLGQGLSVAVSEGGKPVEPFPADRNEENDWRAFWAVTVDTPEPLTVFQDVETGALGVVRLRDGVPSMEFPDDQTKVVAALEAHLINVLHPGSKTRGVPGTPQAMSERMAPRKSISETLQGLSASLRRSERWPGYAAFRQAERGLVDEEDSVEERIERLSSTFRSFGTVDWYNHDVARKLRVAVAEEGGTLGPFVTDRSETNDWHGRWAVTVTLPEVVTIFQDAESGLLGVERSGEKGPAWEIPEDQEAVVAALESYLTITLHPASTVDRWPIEVYQIHTVHEPKSSG